MKGGNSEKVSDGDFGIGAEIVEDVKESVLKGVDEEEKEKEKEVKLVKKNKGVKRKKSVFEEYLEEDTKRNSAAAEYDLKQERMLAKKLKVKKGKFEGVNDILNDIFSGFGGVPGDEDMFEDLEVRKKKKNKKQQNKDKDLGNESEDKEDSVRETSEQDDMVVLDAEKKEETSEASLEKCKLRKKKVKSDKSFIDVVANSIEEANASETPKEEDAPQDFLQEKSVKYVPPHLRNVVKNELEQYAPMRRRIRGMTMSIYMSSPD